MGAGISPMGTNVPQQSQGQGKGGGGSAFSQPTMQMPSPAPGLAQQMNIMRPGQAPMSIDEFARSGMMGPTTQEFRSPVAYDGGMYDPALVQRYEQYTSGQTQAPMNQIGDMRFMQPSQTPMQAQLAADAQRRANLFNQQTQADALQGRRQVPQTNDQMRMEQMPAPGLAQQMAAQRRMDQGRRPEPMPRDPRFGGLGALMQAQRAPRQSLFQARSGMGKGGGGFFRSAGPNARGLAGLRRFFR